jgi:ribosomal protein S18 acetylase RimI-like enzyme
MKIPRATADDAEAISSLLLEAFQSVRSRYTKGAFEYTTPPAEVIRQRFPEGPIWVALEGDSIVGTVSGLPEPDRFYIRSMAVKPDAQGRGIGQRLLETLEEYARQHMALPDYTCIRRSHSPVRGGCMKETDFAR